LKAVDVEDSNKEERRKMFKFRNFLYKTIRI